MAKESRVKKLFADELSTRASEQFEKVGDDWPEVNMGFFFPENEETVDLCALAVLDAALNEDQTTVPKSVRKNIRTLINTGRKAKDAVSIIALATLQPSPKKS
jgi:hypothetical protein